MADNSISGGRRNTDLVQNKITMNYFDRTPDGKYYIPHTNIQVNPFIDYSVYNFGLGNAGGGTANALQTVSTVNTVTGIFASTTQGVVQSTMVGANFTYAISGNRVLLNSVANGFKYAPYVGLFVTIGTGSYLSISINPATNLPYQSWVETGIDIGANLGIIYLGSQYGGWVGAGAATIYVVDKAAFNAYMNTVREHPDWVLPPSVHPFTH